MADESKPSLNPNPDSMISHEAIDALLPGVLTQADKSSLRSGVEVVIKENGIGDWLKSSSASNVKEFQSTVSYRLEKVRNDLHPTYAKYADGLIQQVHEHHIRFLEGIAAEVNELETEVQELRGDKAAVEKLQEHWDQLNDAHRERLEEIDRVTARIQVDLINKVPKYKTDSNERNEFISSLKALSAENGKLKRTIAEAFRVTQMIRFYNAGSRREELSTILGG